MTSCSLISDLFAYGSLMCEDIMASVIGRQVSAIPARLEGYRRFALRDETYPAVIASVYGAVEGMVYPAITAEGWRRLDRFEGEMYDRKPVTVQYADGSEALACSYLLRAEYLHRLTAVEWDLAAFIRDGKQKFKMTYFGFNTKS